MNTIHEKLKVLCKSDTKVYELLCTEYEENIDEIIIRTSVRETELSRGWIGDLHYSTGRNIDISTGYDTEFIAEESYKDVLLISVNIWGMDDGVITWEYKFLKK